MIDSAKIDLLGDAFEVFSLGCDEKTPEDMKINAENVCVFLTPSLAADFSLKAYSSAKEEYCDYYAAALIAAAFLVVKRGLPLSDIVFETPRGNITVFHTGSGKFKIRVEKCKLLFSSKLELSGCEIKYDDIFISEKIRAVHTDDMALFKTEKLCEFVVSDSPFPSAVILSMAKGQKLDVRSYRDFSVTFISNFLLWCGGAYNEKMKAGSAPRKFVSEEYGSVFEPAASAVVAEVQPIIL